MIEQGERFSLDDAVSFSWKSMKKYFFPLLGIMVVNFIIVGVLGAIGTAQQIFMKHMDTMGFILMIVGGLASMVVGVVIDLGMYRVALRVCDDLPIDPRDVFSVYTKFWPYLGASILFHAMRILGFICLIVPGVIIHLVFQFYPYFMLEENLGPIQALKASHRVSKDIKLDLFLFGIVLFFIDWVGGLLLLVGKIPAYMMCTLAKASVYRQLVGNNPMPAAPTEPPPATSSEPPPTASSEPPVDTSTAPSDATPA